MGPNLRKNIRLVNLGIAVLFGVFASAQDVKLNLTYVCSGERMYVESCNIRDLSDNATCQVAHPDRPQHNGFMAYTSETRGSLKKLLPTCTQPTAKEIANEEAFKKKQQELYDAAVAKANPQPPPQAANQPNAGRPQSPVGMPAPPKNAEERAIRSSWRDAIWIACSVHGTRPPIGTTSRSMASTVLRQPSKPLQSTSG
jgi:hypothetical protein